jgi:hypothetical protein
MRECGKEGLLCKTGPSYALPSEIGWIGRRRWMKWCCHPALDLGLRPDCQSGKGCPAIIPLLDFCGVQHFGRGLRTHLPYE